VIQELFSSNIDEVKKIDLEREKLSREIRATLDFSNLGTNLDAEQQLAAENMALVDNIITNIIRFTRPRDIHVDQLTMAHNFAMLFASRYQEMNAVSLLTPEKLDA